MKFYMMLRIKLQKEIALYLLNVICVIPIVTNQPLIANEIGKIKHLKTNTLFILADYSTQTNTFGKIEGSIKQPNYSASLFYFSKYNFDGGIRATIAENSDTSLSKPAFGYNFSIGYTYMPTKKITIYPSFTHLVYDRNSDELGSIFRNILQVDMFYSGDHYYCGITPSGLFGSKNTFFASFQNAIGFNVNNFILSQSMLSIQLELDINFSDKNFYNELIYDQYLPIDLNNGNEFAPSYSITSLDVIIPIFYSVGNLIFNFTPFVYIPAYNSEYYDQSVELILNAGISCFFDFK